MPRSTYNPRLDGLVQHYVSARPQDHARLHLVCSFAVLFALLGLLFAINIGLVLIAIAAAILYYCRYGERIAIALALIFLVMLAVWMMLMPARHLVAVSLCILAPALAGAVYGQVGVTPGKPILRFAQSMLAAPVCGLLALRENLLVRQSAAQTGLRSAVTPK